jgi:hypothetical protein
MLRTHLIPFAFAAVFLAGCHKDNVPATRTHVKLTLITSDCLGTIVSIDDAGAHALGNAGYPFDGHTYTSAAVVEGGAESLGDMAPGDVCYADIAATPYKDYIHCAYGIPPSKAISILKRY